VRLESLVRVAPEVRAVRAASVWAVSLVALAALAASVVLPVVSVDVEGSVGTLVVPVGLAGLVVLLAVG
jgi:hypothetical protein